MMAERVVTQSKEDPTRVVELEGEVPFNGPIKPMSDACVQSLNAAESALQKKVLVGNLLPKLLNSKGGFLDDVERGKVESGGSNQLKMHFLLEILKTKDDAALTTFCKVLEDSKYAEAAEKLKKEIASRGHLLTSSLGDCPSEIELDKVSKIVGGQWESLLVHLGVPAAKTESLFQDYLGKTQSACFHGLVFWQKKNEPCRPATWSVLLHALEKGAELKEYADRKRSELLSLTTACQTESLEKIHKVLREKNVALSLSPLEAAVKKLEPALAEVLSEFRHHVTRLLPKSSIYNKVRSKCQTMIVSKAGISSFNTFNMPLDVSEFAEYIIREHTTFFDIELIHEVANLLQQPTLTETVVRYEADLKPLMMTSITELTDRCEVMPINQDSPEGTYQLVLRFPDDANVKNLCKAKDYLEKVLHIPDAKLLAFDHGCILAYFEIICPPNILKDLPKRFTKHSKQLKAMGISGAFLIDHWACGADSDGVWYTNDENHDDMEVNEQQGFLRDTKRSHFGSVSGECVDTMPSKNASHLKESCATDDTHLKADLPLTYCEVDQKSPIYKRNMTNFKIKREIRTALESAAEEKTRQRGFQSGKFRIDEDDWDTLVQNLHSVQLQGNRYRVSLPRHISVNIQPGLGVPIGAVSGTLVGGGVRGVSGATIGAIVGSVIPGPGTLIGAVVGGLIGTGVGSGVGATGGGEGGAIIGKGAKKYEQNFRIYAEDILSYLSGVYTDDNTVYATVKY